ncbi:MAG TPA: hypothetical protein VER17_18320 [Tepidisphaeraceae bacterium]|nr:hypothetical protein [Tepidisphaeraceae bacterium]
MPETLIDVLYILNRYVHIICTTVIVGGTLFFELIVPVATGDLKREQQLSVFGRARWSFKAVVITCAVLLVISGVVSTMRLWRNYTGGDRVMHVPVDAPGPLKAFAAEARRPGWWWVAHSSTGVLALIVAVSLMTVRRPPDSPLYWMRLSLTILMVVIFLAVAARHMRLSHLEAERHPIRSQE